MYINMSISGEKYICTYWSPELRKKISERQIGRKSPNPKGSSIKQETKDKISKTLTGRKRSLEARKSISAGKKGLKMKNKKSKESIQKGIETMKKIRTPEWLKKFGDNLKGEKNPFYGKKHSLEAREKMSKTDRSYLSKSFWWNNGISEKRCENSPGEGWIKGRKLKNSQ